MPEKRIPTRPFALLAASGLALAATSAALGQGDPLGEPFPAVLDLDELDGVGGFRAIGAGFEHFSGWSMDAAGDVNGDGVGDLLLGVPGLLIGTGWHGPSGAAIVLYGRSEGDPFPPRFDLATIDGDNGFLVHALDDDIAGYTVGAAGDVNGDGLADIAVGAPHMLWSPGRGYVVFGRSGNVPAERLLYELGDGGFQFDAPAGIRWLAVALSHVGDVNGDGRGDLGVGARGEAFVLFGRDAGDPFSRRLLVTDLDGSDGFRIDPVDGSDRLGRSLSPAGDINGDGYDDMLVGAPGANPGGGGATGAAYVIFGREGAFPPRISAADLDGTNGFRLEGVSVADETGFKVASAGDFNGDGVNDLVIGAWGASPRGIAGAGAAYLVFGRGGAYPPAIDLASLDGASGLRLDGFGEYDQAGIGVAGAGDVNGDGLADVAIGGFGGPPGETYGPGVAFVVFGTRETLPATLDLGELDGRDGFAMTTAAVEDALGWAVSPAGDLNGDGMDDLAIAAPWASPEGRYRAGVVHIVYGRDTTPCPADLDADGALTIFDFLEFQNLFDLMDPRADFDGDGDLTIFDFLAFQNAFDAGC
jgi:glycosylphosphatidylinositol phospholipase D